jgi:hypothetical protein
MATALQTKPEETLEAMPIIAVPVLPDRSKTDGRDQVRAPQGSPAPAKLPTPAPHGLVVRGVTVIEPRAEDDLIVRGVTVIDKARWGVPHRLVVRGVTVIERRAKDDLIVRGTTVIDRSK